MESAHELPLGPSVLLAEAWGDGLQQQKALQVAWIIGPPVTHTGLFSSGSGVGRPQWVSQSPALPEQGMGRASH